MADSQQPTRARRWTGRANEPSSVRNRRRTRDQECPADPDCGWTAAEDDHHALAAHLREHKR